MIDQIVCFTILFPFLFMYMAKHSVFLKLENWGKDEMKILYSHILIWDSKGEKNWLNVFPYEKTKLNSFQSNFFKTKKRIFRQVKRNETMFLSLVCFVLFCWINFSFDQKQAKTTTTKDIDFDHEKKHHHLRFLTMIL